MFNNTENRGLVCETMERKYRLICCCCCCENNKNSAEKVSAHAKHLGDKCTTFLAPVFAMCTQIPAHEFLDTLLTTC